MTGKKSIETAHKVDGRKLRRGKRGRYHRKQIEGNDRLIRYVQLLMAIMEYLEVPVRVEYSPTDSCRELLPILEQLSDWAEARM